MDAQLLVYENIKTDVLFEKKLYLRGVVRKETEIDAGDNRQ